MRVFLFMINQQMHFYKHVQSSIIVFQQHVSVTTMTISRMLYNRNAVLLHQVILLDSSVQE